jgi:GntR family transcriptional regulator/MocR family aminotransferase
MELMVSLVSAKRVPFYQQVYSQIRDAILGGRLQVGGRLPSTRDLAAQYEISRNTVNLAYERLLSEGYIEAKRGSGTYVASIFSTPVARKRWITHRPAEPIALAESVRNLEKWIYTAPYLALPYDFRQGIPALEHFPLAIWRRIVARHLRRISPDLARYGEPAGYRPLREAIASYLQRSRAVHCDAEQVVVTTGSQQALDLLARLLVMPGQQVVVENPCYPAAAAAFRAAGAKLRPVTVDDQGMQTSALPPDIRLLYVTPSHQHPTGVFLSIQRRLQLLAWARDHRTVIIEDDYDCEFRYGSRPVESLQGLDQAGLVVYTGTFSKVLLPGLRLGYVVLPQFLIKPFLALKWIADRHSSGWEQRFMADFMLQGHFERYLRRMHKVYEDRRETLIESLGQHTENHIDIIPSVAGLHLAGWIKGKVDMTRLKTLAAESGVGTYLLTPYFLKKPRPGLLFGYSALAPEDIRRGIRRLGHILDKLSSS